MSSQGASELVLNIDIGTKLSLEMEDWNGDRFAVVLVGYVHNRFIITTDPILPREARVAFNKHIYPGRVVNIRYISRGRALGFSSELIRQQVVGVPIPLLFFTYPAEVEVFQFRSHERIDCLFPARIIHKGISFPCMVSDISVKGCSLMTADGPGLDMELGSEIQFETHAFHGSDALGFTARVQRLTRHSNQVNLGLEIVDISKQNAVLMEKFIQLAKRLTA